MQEHHQTIDGIRMRWLEHGEGHPVVFIHGIPTSPEVWRHVLPQTQGARCLAWEMVGFGESIPEGEDRDISLDRQAEYLASWMDAIGLERAMIVGHDLGGGVSQIFAVRHPERVEGLVLTNCVCYDEWPVWPVDLAKKLAPVLEHTPEAVLKPLFNALIRRLHDDQEMAEEAFDLHWRRYAEHDGPDAFARQASALDSDDTEAIADDLPSLRMPTRLVWGAADPYLTIDVGRRLADDLHAPIDCIDEGNHFIIEDHPDRIARAVSEVLAEIR